jgi:hypothetical protein
MSLKVLIYQTFGATSFGLATKLFDIFPGEIVVQKLE